MKSEISVKFKVQSKHLQECIWEEILIICISVLLLFVRYYTNKSIIHNVSDHNLLFLIFRLEKEYTTIKTKEMEEQVEIKVRSPQQIYLWTSLFPRWGDYMFDLWM